MTRHDNNHETIHDGFEAWYCAAEAASRGRIVGERLALKPYWMAGFTQDDAVRFYLGWIDHASALTIVSQAR